MVEKEREDKRDGESWRLLLREISPPSFIAELERKQAANIGAQLSITLFLPSSAIKYRDTLLDVNS